MIITRTPVRITFLGGGTDYPEYFLKHGGATLGMAIDKYSYITVNNLNRFHDYNFRVSYSRVELVDEVDEIQHPAVRECLRFMDIQRGVEIHYMGDLPARTGLGSSSSFTVGLLNALYALKGQIVSPEELARQSVHVEREMIGERVGVQDQYTCALGGFCHLQFDQRGTIRANPVVIRPDRLEDLQKRLVLFYTGIRRQAHKVLEEQINRTQKGEATHELSSMLELVQQALDVLCNDHRLSDFGDLLHQGWLLKRQLSSAISTPAIDKWYERARRAGAVGGKLLGAGGGGFLLFFIEPEHQDDVRKALSELRQVPIRLEEYGSQVIFYRPQTEDI